MSRVRAVVFDLYETLVTEFDPGWRAGTTPAERLGIPGDVLERVWRSRKADRMTRAVDFRDVLRAACVAAGVVVGEAIEEIIQTLYAERLAAKAKPLLEVEAPVVEMLGRLKAMDLKLGLVSNCSIEEVAAWHESPLAGLFDEIVFSYEAGCAKPDCEIYLRACQRLGVLPADTIFVGDGGSDELSGAAAVGMTPYCARWFLDRWPSWRRSRTDRSSRQFPQLSEPDHLTAILKRR